VNRELDLSNTNLVDFSLALTQPSFPRDTPILQNLNLSYNLLIAFHGNSINSLEQLNLDGNNILEFCDNDLNDLQGFSIVALSNLTNISGNTVPTLTTL
jgi:Leucine-rich repeat (LRR) protein